MFLKKLSILKMTTPTVVSDTDIQVFANLVNPQKVNVNRIMESDTEVQMSEDEKNRVSSEDDDDDRETTEERSTIGNEDANTSISRLSQQMSYVSQSRTNDAQSWFKSPIQSPKNSPASSVASKKRSQTSKRSSSNNSSRESSKQSSPKSNASSHRSQTQASKVSDARSYASNRTAARSEYRSEYNQPLPTLPFENVDTEILEKQEVLVDMERLKMNGIKMSKEWTLNDRLEDMKFEVRRHMLHIDEIQNVKMMRDGMRLMCSGFEILNGRFGLLELDGWASEVCQDMERYDNALGRIYRKYWRKSSINSPEMEILFSLCSSVGMYHFKQKMQKHIFTRSNISSSNTKNFMPNNASRKKYQVPDSSDDDSDSAESAPPES
jgi:hypothetical protein